MKRLFKGQVLGALNELLKLRQNQKKPHDQKSNSVLAAFSDVDMQSNALQSVTAANPALTTSQIQNGFNRKKSGMVERPKSQNLMGTGKAKARKLLSPEVKHQPPQEGYIPKSKEYLKRIFESEFWPIVQELLNTEVDRRLALVLDCSNLYDHENNRLTYEQLFAHNFQSQDIEIVKLKGIKEQLVKRNWRIKIKVEQIEEILLRMGFMRNSENVEDKLEFMNLKEQL